MPERDEDSGRRGEVTNEIELGHYYRDIEIDPDKLDNAAIKQPVIRSSVGARFAHAKAEFIEAKDRLKRIEARLAIDIRADHDRKGEKLTEAALAALVQVNSKRRKAFDAMVDAQRLQDELEELRDSYAERGFMLKVLAELHKTDYFSDSSVKGGVEDGKRQRDSFYERANKRKPK
jgi:hypothetical protein